MGIRFACHVCSKRLNIKQELAGKRGICPACSAKFRIPLEDAETSTPVDETIHREDVPSRPTNGQATAGNNGDRQVESPAVATSVGAAAPDAIASIDLIDGDPTSTWYVRPPSGGQYGPATGEILRQWISEGRVASTSLLWRDGWPQWREASEALPELVERLPDPSGSERPATTAPTASNSTTASPSAGEFGFGDHVAGGQIDSSPSNKTAASFSSRGEVGSERKSRSNQRTKYIAILTVTAVVLIFALAYVLSR